MAQASTAFLTLSFFSLSISASLIIAEGKTSLAYWVFYGIAVFGVILSVILGVLELRRRDREHKETQAKLDRLIEIADKCEIPQGNLELGLSVVLLAMKRILKKPDAKK